MNEENQEGAAWAIAVLATVGWVLLSVFCGVWGYGQPFSKPFASILAFFFLSFSSALVMYGINKSREIGGWAVWPVLDGVACLWAALALWGF